MGGGQPIASPLASPASLNAEQERRLSIHSPPLIPRGLWGTPPAGHTLGDRHDSGLLGRELLPSELKGDGDGDFFDIEIDEDNDESSTGGSASGSELSSIILKPSPQARKETTRPLVEAGAAEPAVLFFSREPRRRHQLVVDALTPSRIAKPFSLAEPLPYTAHRRRFSNVSSGQIGHNTGMDRGAGSGSHSSGSSAGNGGAPQKRVSAVALSATSGFSSSGTLESLGKARGGGGASKLDHDQSRHTGAGKGEGDSRSGGNEKFADGSARSQKFARRDKRELDSGRRDFRSGERVGIAAGAGTGLMAEEEAGANIFRSDSSVSDDRLVKAEIRPPTPPVNRSKSIRSVSSTGSSVNASLGGGTGGGSSHENRKAGGDTGIGAKGSQGAASWIWSRTKSGSDRDLKQHNKEKRFTRKGEEGEEEEDNDGERGGQRSSVVAINAGHKERSKVSITMEGGVLVGPGMVGTFVLVDASAEADVVDVTVRARRGDTQTLLGRAEGKCSSPNEIKMFRRLNFVFVHTLFQKKYRRLTSSICNL